MGTRAIFAAQTMLDTTSHNISNVNTPGFSRQQVELANENGQFTGAGFFGRGVRVVTISRQANDFMAQEVNRNLSGSSSDQTRLDKLTQLEKVFPMGTNGLGFAASQVLNAFVDVANQPQDMSARQVVIARAQEWVSRVNTAGQQIDEIQRGVAMDIQTTVERINKLTSQIGEANQAIASYKGAGHSPNDLLDGRDLLIKQLSELVQVNTVKADDGSMSVFMFGCQLLVLGKYVQQLAAVADPTDSSLRRIGLVNPANGSSRILNDDLITGGSLHGLMRFQDGDLVDTRNRLNSFVSTFANAVNSQQGLGRDINGQPTKTLVFNNPQSATSISVGLGSPRDIAAASPSVAMTPTENRGTAAIESLRVVPDNVVVQFGAADSANGTIDYTLVINGAPGSSGTWTPGQSIDIPLVGGGRYTLNLAGTPQAATGTTPGDSIEIAPSESPFAAIVPSTNRGTASVQSLAMDLPSQPDPDSVVIRFGTAGTAGTINYTLEVNGNTGPTGIWTPGQAIDIPLTGGGRYLLNLTGSPQAETAAMQGDVIEIRPTESHLGNNGNALAMLALRDQAMVSLDGRSTSSVTDAYSQMVGSLGVIVQSGRTSAELSSTLATNSEQVYQGEIGVNLDEEAARLIQFQQSYQAAAKILQVAQKVFDVLLETAR